MTKPIRGGANLFQMSQLISADLIKVQDQYTDPFGVGNLKQKPKRKQLKQNFKNGAGGGGEEIPHYVSGE